MYMKTDKKMSRSEETDSESGDSSSSSSNNSSSSRRSSISDFEGLHLEDTNDAMTPTAVCQEQIEVSIASKGHFLFYQGGRQNALLARVILDVQTEYNCI